MPDILKIVKILLAKGANVNAKSLNNRTALIIASTLGHTGIVKLLLAKGADFNVKDEEGKTALIWAS